MASRGPAVRRLLWLVGGTYVFVLAYVVVYSWATVSPYLRLVFRPQAAESGIALRDCRAAASCAPDAVTLVDRQQSLLDRAVLLVRGTAWLITVGEILVVVVVTVAVAAALRGRRAVAPAVARFTGAAWRVQIALVGVLLLAYAVLLGDGAAVLDDTPASARLPTFTGAFDSPFFDAGHLYYLAWFVVMNAAGIVATWALNRSLRTWETLSPGPPGNP